MVALHSSSRLPVWTALLKIAVLVRQCCRTFTVKTAAFQLIALTQLQWPTFAVTVWQHSCRIVEIFNSVNQCILITVVVCMLPGTQPDPGRHLLWPQHRASCAPAWPTPGRPGLHSLCPQWLRPRARRGYAHSLCHWPGDPIDVASTLIIGRLGFLIVKTLVRPLWLVLPECCCRGGSTPCPSLLVLLKIKLGWLSPTAAWWVMGTGIECCVGYVADKTRMRIKKTKSDKDRKYI